MKKLLFMFCLIASFIACSDDDDKKPENPIQNLQLPSQETPFLTGQSVTIQGKGFTAESQIWLRAVKTKASEDIQADIIEVTDNSITFEVPQEINGEQIVILKQNGTEYDLGSLTFETYQIKYYCICDNDDTQRYELAELDINTGDILLTGIEFPEYGGNSRGCVFSEKTNELITFGGKGRDWVINKANMATKVVITIILKDLDQISDFDDIVKTKDNEFYSVCNFYNDDPYELVEFDVNTGNVLLTGIKFPEFGKEGIGYAFNEKTNEFITFADSRDDKWVINKANMTTKKVTTLFLNDAGQIDGLEDVIQSKDKYYCACYTNDICEIAEIDINTGKVLFTGIKIPEYGSENRGHVFNEKTNELITLGRTGNKWVINKANMITKEVVVVPIKNPETIRNLDYLTAF